MSGFWEQRPDDYFGFAASYTEVSTAVKGYDMNLISFSGEPTPVRTAETLLEATYNAQIMPGFNVQPVFAYVFRPAAGAGLEDQPTKSIPNAAVFGVRTVISF